MSGRISYGIGLDGRERPGVSTIAKIADDSGGLIGWANRQGLKGIDINTPEGKKEATIGTQVHDLMEAYFHQRPLSAAVVPPGSKAWEIWDRLSCWLDNVGAEPIAIEEPLIDPRVMRDFGGTIDCVLRLTKVANKIVLADLKTGAGLYSSGVVQLAGYHQLWALHHANIPLHCCAFIHAPLDGDVRLVELTREQLICGTQAFEAALTIYRLRPALSVQQGSQW